MTLCTPEMVAGFDKTEMGLFVPKRQKPRYSLPTCVDLFCGAGGFSLGMIQGGFQVVMGVDNDPSAMMTYLYNLGSYPCDIRFTSKTEEERANKALQREFKQRNKGRLPGDLHEILVSGGNWHDWNGKGSLPVTHYYFGNVRELTGKMVLDALEMERGELDCVVGSPPCQGFSIGGKRDVMDPTNSLVFEFVRLVLELWPKTMVFENVPGITTMVTQAGLPVIDSMCLMLEEGGFGTADALKASLLATSGAGGALRSGRGGSWPVKDAKVKRPRKPKPEKVEAPPEPAPIRGFYRKRR